MWEIRRVLALARAVTDMAIRAAARKSPWSPSPELELQLQPRSPPKRRRQRVAPQDSVLWPFAAYGRAPRTRLVRHERAEIKAGVKLGIQAWSSCASCGTELVSPPGGVTLSLLGETL